MGSELIFVQVKEVFRLCAGTIRAPEYSEFKIHAVHIGFKFNCPLMDFTLGCVLNARINSLIIHLDERKMPIEEHAFMACNLKEKHHAIH